jgi:peptidoglycan/xylan/chitin deacetylase (PgdA/CDA1 family)
MKIRSIAMAVLIGAVAPAWAGAGEARPGGGAPVIILKLDDIVRHGPAETGTVSPRWLRCVDFIRQEKLKASLGIIGYSLEEDAPAYFKWIRDTAKEGPFEFWHHGYKRRTGTEDTGEFESDSFEDQRAALAKTQALAKEKLGLELRAFGPHWSGTNETTRKALESVPGITIWFFGPKAYTKTTLERTLNLEVPTHVPNFEKVKAGYERSGHAKPYLVLQGHPNSWSDERFAEFVKVVKYLKAKGCAFMTVSEYVAAGGRG